MRPLSPLAAPSNPAPLAPLHTGLARDAARELSITAALLLVCSLAVAQLASFGAAFAPTVMGVFLLGTALVWRGLRRSHPHPRFGPANRVTLGRFALSSMLAGLLGEPTVHGETLEWAVVVMATLTALLDAADGRLARRSGLASPFGARFDMEADAWLTLVLCLLLLRFGQIGAWVLAAGLMRYVFVAAALAWPWLAGSLPPSRRRQAVCVAQITTLIVCLAPVVPPPLAAVLAAASLVALTLSFALDLRYLALARSRRSP
ncbi:MAG: CDP-alcohol phosphatidyltransferase family protein [Rubrivivax sp.]